MRTKMKINECPSNVSVFCLGDDEEAIPALATHFKSVIKAIGEGKWLHYANPTRMGTPLINFFSKTQMEAKLTLDLQPKSFFLQPRLLAVKLASRFFWNR